MTENHTKRRYISPETEIYDITHDLDKSFSERRKARRRARGTNISEQKKEDVVAKTNSPIEVYKPSQDEKERERFRKMGYVRRVKYLVGDVEELRKTSHENRKLIREINVKIESLAKTGVLKVKFNTQHLQKEVLKFVTFGQKEGYIIIENGEFARIEE